MRLIVTRAVLTLGLLAGFGASAAAEPALFAARDTDTTIYLFGTIHGVPCNTSPADGMAAPGCAPWMTGAIEAAFAAADELWLEADLADDAADAALVQRYGFLDGARLTDYLTEADLRVAAEIIGGPMAEAVLPQLDAMQPWLVTLLLTQAAFAAGGVSFEHGVDYTLMRLAAERGVPVNGFETGEDQLRVLMADPVGIQVADLRTITLMPAYGADPVEFLAWMFEKLWAMWLAGDLDELSELLIADNEAFLQRYGVELGARLRLDEAGMAAIVTAMDAVYEGVVDPAQRALDDLERMVAERNRNWMPDIRDMLARPGTFFVAVGAGHLVGDDGLPALIGQEGAEVTRIQ